MFSALFTDHDTVSSEMIEPYIKIIGEDNLELFYKWIWVRCKNPEIENFGKRFFLEMGDWKYQMTLLKKYLATLQSSYTDMAKIHQMALMYYINEELDDDQQEKLAIFESNLITEAENINNQ